MFLTVPFFSYYIYHVCMCVLMCIVYITKWLCKYIWRKGEIKNTFLSHVELDSLKNYCHITTVLLQSHFLSASLVYFSFSLSLFFLSKMCCQKHGINCYIILSPTLSSSHLLNCQKLGLTHTLFVCSITEQSTLTNIGKAFGNSV